MGIESRDSWIRSIPAWAGEPLPTITPNALLKVYPRVGGGTQHMFAVSCRGSGLSPRGRGNLGHRRIEAIRIRSIPAWAGEPGGLDGRRPSHWVYPRVGGGTRSFTPSRACTRGLSPRGRGNLNDDGEPVWPTGSIPAWAGEPPEGGRAGRLGTVYPRVGGGNPIEPIDI